MASTSGSRSDGVTGRIRNAATALYSDNQSLTGEIRKFMNVMKVVAVDLEKENHPEMVKELENGVVELLEAYDNCAHLTSAIDSVKDNYQPGEELTNFEKLFDDEIAKLKASSTIAPRNNPYMRQFKEAIWKVHHAGQPMPGEEQEDIVMTSTESSLLNVTCPLSGKPVTDIPDPVRSMDCRHIYEKTAVQHYIKTNKGNPKCPAAGCPKVLQAGRVICDQLLLIEIEEARETNKETVQPTMIEDTTELDEN